MKVSRFTKPELDYFRAQCNFTDEELECFNLKAKDRTNLQIALELNMSESKVSSLSKRIRTKIFKVKEWEV